MKLDVILPKQGMYEGDVELIEWLVADRIQVTAGQPIFLLGTDKVESEILAEQDGWLIQVCPDGHVAPVGSTVGHIVTTVEELP
jgi:pyruvate/2-oxoglutarate dehydrogenase complex dihydrolipoamide acyltransferase (E2) component